MYNHIYTAVLPQYAHVEFPHPQSTIQFVLSSSLSNLIECSALLLSAILSPNDLPGTFALTSAIVTCLLCSTLRYFTVSVTLLVSLLFMSPKNVGQGTIFGCNTLLSVRDVYLRLVSWLLLVLNGQSLHFLEHIILRLSQLCAGGSWCLRATYICDLDNILRYPLFRGSMRKSQNGNFFWHLAVVPLSKKII